MKNMKKTRNCESFIEYFGIPFYIDHNYFIIIKTTFNLGLNKSDLP